jgi:hypothetical protein
MIELAPEHFSTALALLQELNQAQPLGVLPFAVLEGFNPGWVFVDDPLNPASLLIGLPCGYFFAAGRPPAPAELAGLAGVIRDGLIARSAAAGNYGFLFGFGAQEWQASLPGLLPGCTPIQIYRRSFCFDPRLFSGIERDLPPLPPGFRLMRIDAPALAAFPDLRSEVACNWRCPEDFLRDGGGVCILRGEELVSFCLSPFACQDALEISVLTAPPFRRRGFARLAAAAFLRLCLDAGKRPNWECFWDNLPSVELALSLGFSFDQDRPVFYWEESPAVLS